MPSTLQTDTLLAALFFATIFIFGWRLHVSLMPCTIKYVTSHA
jgi:hypothetical protein